MRRCVPRGRRVPRTHARPLPDDLSDDETRFVRLLHRVRERCSRSRRWEGDHVVPRRGRAPVRDDRRRRPLARVLCVMRPRSNGSARSGKRRRSTCSTTQDADGVPDAWVDLIADLAAIGHVNRIVAALLPEGLDVSRLTGLDPRSPTAMSRSVCCSVRSVRRDGPRAAAPSPFAQRDPGRDPVECAGRPVEPFVALLLGASRCTIG